MPPTDRPPPPPLDRREFERARNWAFKAIRRRHQGLARREEAEVESAIGLAAAHMVARGRWHGVSERYRFRTLALWGWHRFLKSPVYRREPGTRRHLYRHTEGLSVAAIERINAIAADREHCRPPGHSTLDGVPAAVDAALAEMPPRAADIVARVIGHGRPRESYREIAAALGVTDSPVHRTAARHLPRLRELVSAAL